MGKLVITFIITIFLGGAMAVYIAYDIGYEQAVKNIAKEKTEKIKPEITPPNFSYIQEELAVEPPHTASLISSVILSSRELKQADTVVLSAISLGKPRAKFETTKIDFFETEKNKWLAVFGIDAKALPGSKNILVEFPNGAIVSKEFIVNKHIWPVTEFTITKELAEKGYSTETITQGIILNENVLIREVTAAYRDAPYFSGPFVRPLENINIVGVYGNIRKSGLKEIQHLGVDLDAAKSTEAFAINDGVVVLSRDDLINYGKTLIIDHGLGIFSLYLHLSEIKAVPGQFVKAGEIVALSGNTGYSIEPHLHFSMKVNNASIDPLKFIDTFNRAFD